ncbi:Uncharacterised protein [Legionella lansingensis]|nr:Uncharacterised protein [Legionella lansingensis]
MDVGNFYNDLTSIAGWVIFDPTQCSQLIGLGIMDKIAMNNLMDFIF